MKIPSWLILLSLLPLAAQSPHSRGDSPSISSQKGSGLQTLPQWRAEANTPRSVSNEAIVIFSNLQPQARSAQFSSVERQLGGAIVSTTVIGKNTYALVRLTGKPEEAEAAMSRMKAPGVTVHPNGVHETYSNDPMFSRQWALYNDGTFNEGNALAVAGADIDIQPAWEITQGSEDVIVAVIDTGVDYNHPDLAPNMWRNPGEIPDNNLDDDGNGFVDDVVGYDFGGTFATDPPDNDPMDLQGHGTHVAGIIGAAANNEIGIAGVSPNVRIMAAKNFSDYGFAMDYNSIQAIAYAVANGARVINASWGGYNYNEALKQAIADAGEQGVLFVAAAGNEATNIDFDMPLQVSYPSGYNLPNLVSVASTDEGDGASVFTNRGQERVHLAAPGDSILSTLPAMDLFFSLAASNSKTSSQPRLNGNLQFSNQSQRSSSALNVTGSFGQITFPVVHLPKGAPVFFSMDYGVQMGQDAKIGLEMYDGAQWRKVAQASGLHGAKGGSYSFAVPQALPASVLQFRLIVEAAEPVSLALKDVQIFRYLKSGDPNANYDNAYGMNSGTSMAAPQVSGVAALLLAQDPSATVDQLVSRLLSGAEPITAANGITLSGARLNALGSLNAMNQSGIATPFENQTFAQGQYAPFIWSLAGGEQALSATLYQGDTPVSGTQQNVSHQNGYVNWFTPNTTAGSNYRIQLNTTGGAYFSQPFSIRDAQPAVFPDPALRAALVDWFDKNRDGQITITEVERFDDYLTLEAINAQSLQGIHQFSNIWGLGVGQMPELENLGTLPSSLLILRTANTALTHLGQLPQQLQELALWATPLESLATLPDSIRSLTLAATNLEQLPNLPTDVSSLDLSYNRLISIPPLNGSLNFLNLSGNPLEVPALNEPGLFQLALDDMELESLPSLDGVPSLSILSCINNRLTQLPDLPTGIFMLFASGNRLESLPELPFDYAFVDVSNNRLTSLPALDGVSTLYANRNQIETLPTLPFFMSNLNLDDNLITELLDLPQFLFGLQARNNRITQFPEISPYMYNLALSGNQIETVPAFSSDVLQDLDLSNNLITEMPDMSGLTNLIMVHLSNNFLTDVPHLLEDHLSVVHMDGNYFGADDCQEIQRLHDLDPRGFTFRLFSRWIGPDMDGLSLNPQGDGTVVHCGQTVQSEAVSNLEAVRLSPHRWQITWSGGRIANHVIDDFMVEVYRDGQLSSGYMTSETRAILNLNGGDDYEVVVTPFNYPEQGPSARLFLDEDDDDNDDRDGLEDEEEEAERHFRNRRVYHIPNFTRTSGDWWEMAAVNSGDKAVWVKLRAYDEDGNRILKLPIAKRLRPGQQIRIDSALRGRNLGQVAWFQLRTSGPCSFISLAGNGKEAYTATVTDQLYRRGTVGLGHRFVSMAPELHAINPNKQPAHVDFSVYDHEGQVMKVLSRTIPARGAITVQSDEFAAPAEAGLVIWESTQPLATTEVSRNTGMRDYAFTQQQQTMGATSGWLPYSGEFVHIQNTNPYPISVNFQSYVDGKADLARTISVPAYGYKFMDAYVVLFTVNSEPTLSEGNALYYHAEAPVKVSMEIQPWNMGVGPIMASFMGDMVPAVSQYESRFTVSRFTTESDLNTQVTVVNIIESPTAVTLTAYDRSGRRLGSVDRQVPGYGRTVFDASQLTQASFAAYQGRIAWVRITSGNPLTVQAAYLGDNTAPYMAAQHIAPDEL